MSDFRKSAKPDMSQRARLARQKDSLEECGREIASLRASNAALKEENEAAVKNMAALQSELAAFKNWQPSDPGTKEAMEKADSLSKSDRALMNYGWIYTLAHALRAAMVRLEEAEKENARLLENAKACAEGDCHEDSVPRSRYNVACDQYNECEKKRKELFDRCRELESR